MKYLIGWKGYAVALAIGMGAAWFISANIYELKIESLKLEHAEEKAVNAADALKQLEDGIAQINLAALDYGRLNRNMNTRFDGLQKEFHDAKQAVPLAVDCKPDNGRLQSLRNAIEATNTAVRQ